MKVYSFTEFYGLTPKEKYEYLMKIGLWEELLPDRFYITGNEQRFTEIYYQRIDQTFRPELITQLFEGWSSDTGYEYLCGSSYAGFIFADRSFYLVGRTMTADGLKKEPTKTSTPRIVDDFINDCKRAWGELYWRIK